MHEFRERERETDAIETDLFLFFFSLSLSLFALSFFFHVVVFCRCDWTAFWNARRSEPIVVVVAALVRVRVPGAARRGKRRECGRLRCVA